jgi:hypothetical protein
LWIPVELVLREQHLLSVLLAVGQLQQEQPLALQERPLQLELRAQRV